MGALPKKRGRHLTGGMRCRPRRPSWGNRARQGQNDNSAVVECTQGDRPDKTGRTTYFRQYAMSLPEARFALT